MNAKIKAFWNDERIREAVVYYESKGHTQLIKSPDQLQDRFVEFKHYIKRGSFTIDQLEKQVYSEHGIMSPLPQMPKINSKDLMTHLQAMTKDLEKKEEDKKAKGKQDEKGKKGKKG